MTAPHFTAQGKQVLFAGSHYADACDETAARAIVTALNVGWQPIETAPRDGTEILAYSEHGCTGVMLIRHIALCDFLTEPEADEYFRQGGTIENFEAADWFAADFIQGERLSADVAPTAWMPLPDAPTPSPSVTREGGE